MALVVIRRFQRWIVRQKLGGIGQEVARQIGIDDVLLDIDHVIDAGSSLHVLDRLVIHLVPGCGLDVDADAGQLLELGGQHVLDVVRWRGRFGDTVQHRALIGLGGFGPECGGILRMGHAGGHGEGNGRCPELVCKAHLLPPWLSGPVRPSRQPSRSPAPSLWRIVTNVWIDLQVKFSCVFKQ